MVKIWSFIKKWAWAMILGLITILFAGRKPLWVRHKEEEIKARDKKITKAKEEISTKAESYEEVKAGHDEIIKKAKEGKSGPGFTNPDDAAKYIDDILGKRK